MSGECEECNEHTLECRCTQTESLLFTIKAPEGYTFDKCSKCKCPFLYDGTSDKCILCTIVEMEDSEISC